MYFRNVWLGLIEMVLGQGRRSVSLVFIHRRCLQQAAFPLRFLSIKALLSVNVNYWAIGKTEIYQ